MTFLNFILCDGAPAAGTAATSTGGAFSQLLLPLLLMGVVMYFFMIRPQQKRNKELEQFRNGLAKGDKDGLVDLTGGVNIDAAEEQYQASEREDKGCYEL